MVETRSLITIVEGPSEVDSVPVLLRRILDDLGECRLKTAKPFKVHRNRIVKPGELEKAIQFAIRDRDNPACILVLLGADDDLPCELGPNLLDRCRRTTNLPVAVTVANHEYESWFLGAKESLRGCRGIRSDVMAPNDPESIRGAKERLSTNMENRRYLSTTDQPAFSELFDLNLARKRCPSFDKFWRDVKRIVDEANQNLDMVKDA